MENKKIYDPEEIKKIAPGYRGKPENFNLLKMKAPRDKPKAKFSQNRRPGPSSDETPKPKFINEPQNPTPQRNELIINEAIFGVDVSVVPIEPRQNFATSFANLPQISRETYDNFGADEKFLDRLLTKEEFLYYNVALTWIRIVDLKAKQGRTALTTEEKEIRKATLDKVFNTPQPIALYLSQIGNVIDKMGKETEIDLPVLPIARAQNFGGYPAAAIAEGNHNLFEEIPSLGIAADAVMSVATNEDNPQQPVRVAIPAGSAVTNNLLCYERNIGPRRMEIRQRLTGQGISGNDFPEFIPNTRFNLKYIQSISDIIGKIETFRVEKLVLPNLNLLGGETQIVVTRPIANEDQANWTRTTVQASSSACESTATMGAAYVFGFQLHKEQIEGDNLTAQSQRWSCLNTIADAEAPWAITAAWVNNRNDRRNMPPGIGTERFRAIGKRQDITTSDVIRRMIKTHR